MESRESHRAGRQMLLLDPSPAGSPGVLLFGFFVFPSEVIVLGFVGAVTITGRDVVGISEPLFSGWFSKGNEASAIPGCQSVDLVFCQA